MAEIKGKLTPAEFLAALKGRKPPAKHVSSSQSDEVENLDFSDLDKAGTVQPENSDGANESDAAANNRSDDGSGSAPNSFVGHYVKRHSRLTELFDRVNTLLSGSNQLDPQQPFRPKAPDTLEETGLTFEEVERLILKFLLAKGSSRGRGIANQVRLPFQVIDPILKQLKSEQVVALKGAAEMLPIVTAQGGVRA